MSLEDTINKLSLYDAKKYFRKAQNVVFNYTDMEAKVREATNNEPWGASSTLMEKISQGTYNNKEREEILGMLFKRFTEKSANEWRQIYKALQLLEYLIKYGSERFIDDVRANLNLIEILESFHYIDSQNRDQGINIRNRANCLVNLLNSDDQIRISRKKARETSKKCKGVMGNSLSQISNKSVNPNAGYTRSTACGISISADFDSDDDESYLKPLPYGSNELTEFEEYQPVITTQHSGIKKESNLIFDQKNTKENNNNDDDDDDFDDFQVAPQVSTEKFKASVPSSFHKDQFSQKYSTPQQNQDIGTFNNRSPDFNTIVSEIHTDKKDDVFNSLFFSAKHQSMNVSKPALSSDTLNHHENLDSCGDSNNDMFDDLISVPKSQNSPPKSSNEIDLLSF